MRAVHRTATMIMTGVILLLVVYTVVVELMHRKGTDAFVAGDVNVIRYSFFAVAAGVVLIVQVIRGFMLRSAPGDVASATRRLVVANVITAVLSELPALLGLALFIVWGQYADFYILAIISLYLVVRHYPRYAQWEGFVAQASRTTS